MRRRARWTVALALAVGALGGCFGSASSTPEDRLDFLVIGHRGNPVVAPENTLRSLERAFDVGADAVEVDVRLSRDGVPVLFHDDVLDRTTTARGPVSERSLAELVELTAMSRFDDTARDAIPSLEQALKLALPRGGLLLDVKRDGMAPAIAAVVRRVGFPGGRLSVATWSSAQASEYASHLPQAELLSVGIPRGWRDGALAQAKRRGIDGYEVEGDVPAAFIEAVHGAGLRVYAYTINDGETMRRLIDRGVDGIETDVPELLALLYRTHGGRR